MTDLAMCQAATTTGGAASEARPGPLALFLRTIWFGLIAGLLELGLLLAQDSYRPRVTVDSIRINRHYLWMVPVSDLLIVGACGLLLGLIARAAGGRVLRFVPYPLCFLAAL